MLRSMMLAAALLSATVATNAQEAGPPQELPTAWQVPPGDPLEHMTAGYAKILCSAIFITGRDPATAADEDGFFVSPRAERRAVTDTTVDRQAKAVHLRLANGVTRTARFYGDQGCVTLPRGAQSVLFTPVRVRSSLPDPATQPWPMGDRLPDTPLPAEVDTAKVAAAVAAAFEPPEALTAAFVVAYSGRIVGERYQRGLDRTTRLPSWSMGKSVTATLMGQLIHEGVYELWAPAPVDEWQRPGDARRGIRIADLLHMSSGLRFVAPQDPDYDASRGYPDHLYVYTGAIDAFEWAITRPLQWPPNTRRTLPQLRSAGRQLSHQEGRARSRRGLPVLPAAASLRPARHPQHGDRAGSVRQLPAAGLRLRHGTRLAAPRPALPAGRRLERQAAASRGTSWISCARRRRRGRSRSTAGSSGSTGPAAGRCRRMPTSWQAPAASTRSSFRPTTWSSCGWVTTRVRRRRTEPWRVRWLCWLKRCRKCASLGDPCPPCRE